MKYLVLELQKNTDTDVVTSILTDYTDKAQAESHFHTVLAAAAVSSVPVHSAVLMTDEGKTIKNETYKNKNTHDFD